MSKEEATRYECLCVYKINVFLIMMLIMVAIKSILPLEEQLKLITTNAGC